ncbi:hypothetical protein M231_03544 [Tremella mesenterica]|uniref:Uncharacterized protein n=1 Tax=Tremella mesenterica TaxID=5217 RepID=A0A4V1M455_TREME|nr:hypothetical protein M231_03544 [Tremella mesenterica]
MTPQQTYVSSHGTLTPQPITTRLYRWAEDWGTLGFLLVATLITPLYDPQSFGDPSRITQIGATQGRVAPGGLGGGGGGGGVGLGGGNGGTTGRGGGGNGGNGPTGRGGGGGSGGGVGGGGGGFMTMTQLRGGETVDSCRSTCG